MNNDSNAILDDLLIRWWNWRAPIQPARGYNRSACGLESYRTSRQYDDQNGALDDDLEAQQMAAVEREINSLDGQQRMAIYGLARALSLGLAVFVNPRLPANRAERERLVCDARQKLTQRLMSAGVM